MIEASQNYIISVTIATMSLYFIVYMIYGRIKNRSLIANYKPGTPGYDVFRKLVNNSKYLSVAIVVMLASIAFALREARVILNSSSPHSILFVMPIAFVVLLLVLSWCIPYLFSKIR